MCSERSINSTTCGKHTCHTICSTTGKAIRKTAEQTRGKQGTSKWKLSRRQRRKGISEGDTETEGRSLKEDSMWDLNRGDKREGREAAREDRDSKKGDNDRTLTKYRGRQYMKHARFAADTRYVEFSKTAKWQTRRVIRDTCEKLKRED